MLVRQKRVDLKFCFLGFDQIVAGTINDGIAAERTVGQLVKRRDKTRKTAIHDDHFNVKKGRIGIGMSFGAGSFAVANVFDRVADVTKSVGLNAGLAHNAEKILRKDKREAAVHPRDSFYKIFNTRHNPLKILNSQLQLYKKISNASILADCAGKNKYRDRQESFYRPFCSRSVFDNRAWGVKMNEILNMNSFGHFTCPFHRR